MIWVGDIAQPTGYAEAARGYLRAALAVGYQDLGIVPKQAVPWRRLEAEGDPVAAYQHRRLNTIDQRVRVCHDAPSDCARASITGLYNVAFTVWETQSLPPESRFGINARFREVWVPSAFNAQVMAEAKVRVREGVHVIPHAISLTRADLPPAAKPAALGGRYVFLAVGARNPRKNLAGVIRAFVSAFTSEDPVALIVKSWSEKTWDAEGQQVVDVPVAQEVAALARELGRDPRSLPQILAIERPLPRAQLLGLYAVADCFVSAHRGEAFGLAMAEAKAVGLKVIATGWSGPLDFLDPKVDTLVPYQMVSVAGMGFRPEFAQDQMWADPNLDAMAEAMREAARTCAIGDSAGMERFSLRAVGTQLQERAEIAKANATKLGITIGIPRVTPAVALVATFNARCGIGMYAEGLARALRRRDYPLTCLAEAEGREPDRVAPEMVGFKYARVWRRGRVAEVAAAASRGGILHVQHEFGFWRDETTLGPLISEARAAGAKVVLTLHTVLPAGLAEEGFFRAAAQADALVALSEPGAVALRAWVQMTGGRAQVYAIPQGCAELPAHDRAEARRRMAIPEGVALALHPGFIVPQKRVAEIVLAVEEQAEVLRALPGGFLLLIAGAVRDATDPNQVRYLADLTAYVQANGLSDLVRFHPEFVADDDLPVVMAAADFAILNHTSGPLSTSAVLKTLQAGHVPVCAAAVASLSQAAEGGALIHGDATELSRNLVQIATDAALRESLKEKQREVAEAWPWERVAALHEEMYREVIAGRESASA